MSSSLNLSPGRINTFELRPTSIQARDCTSSLRKVDQERDRTKDLEMFAPHYRMKALIHGGGGGPLFYFYGFVCLIF